MPYLLNLGLDKVFLRKLMKGTHKFEALSKEQSDWRISNSDKLSQKDLFTALLEARDPDTGKALTTEELIAEAGILIVAGTDTTATSLTATIFYLVHYPDALSRVKEEVRKQFASIDGIRIGKELSSCKFLFACFDEAMRLSPGVGAILQREILRGGLIVDGNILPEGTDVGVPAYCIHHNHIYFPEPFEFEPERWLADGLALAYSAFTPFGVGRTSCVGKYLAYQEMAIVLARMVWLYDMRVQPGTTVGEGYKGLGKGRQRKNEFQTYEKFVSSHDGPIVQFRKSNSG
jgi:cytochrome P450